MNGQSFTTVVVRKVSYLFVISLFIGIAAILSTPLLAHAASPVPWECSNYSEEAQTRCLNAFIEHQRERIGKLEGQVQAQQEAMNQLKSQMDRQAATAATMQKQSVSPPYSLAPAVVPPPYAYSYVYPPTIGFGLYLGRPRIYGPPYYYHPYWGPRFYGHWGRGW
ncbi:conserved exported protein of unknown function [Nitrospira sp. KM1]|nr:conserved exported protein of unknown function [Nitrospira sp. KM1]